MVGGEVAIIDARSEERADVLMHELASLADSIEGLPVDILRQRRTEVERAVRRIKRVCADARQTDTDGART